MIFGNVPTRISGVKPRDTILIMALFALLSGLSACGRTVVQLETGRPDYPAFERFEITEDLFLRRIEEGVYVITYSFPWA